MQGFATNPHIPHQSAANAADQPIFQPELFQRLVIGTQGACACHWLATRCWQPLLHAEKLFHGSNLDLFVDVEEVGMSLNLYLFAGRSIETLAIKFVEISRVLKNSHWTAQFQVNPAVKTEG